MADVELGVGKTEVVEGEGVDVRVLGETRKAEGGGVAGDKVEGERGDGGA